MAQDLYRTKMILQKIEELIPTLEKIDIVIELLSHYNTDEAKTMLILLSEYKNQIQEVINNKDNLKLLGDDLKKGSYNGKRKLDIDLALNKKGIAEAKTLEEAINIWIDENTRVYYYSMIMSFSDGSNIGIDFINDDNEKISISTNEELSHQINKSALLAAKMINTRCVVDSGGRVGSLVRITDLTDKVSNIKSVTLLAEQRDNGSQVKLKPTYTWLDTTSILILLMNTLSFIEKLPDDLNEFNDNLTEIINMKWSIQILSHYIKGFCPRIFDMGYFKRPLGDTNCRSTDIFKIVAENIDKLIDSTEFLDAVLLKENNLSDLPNKQVSVDNLGITKVTVENDIATLETAMNKLGIDTDVDITNGSVKIDNTKQGVGDTIGARIANAIEEEYAIQFQLRRGTATESEIFIGAEGEPGFITDSKEFRIGDGITPGGIIFANKEYLNKKIEELNTKVNNLDTKIGDIGDKDLAKQLATIKEIIDSLSISTSQSIGSLITNINQSLSTMEIAINNKANSNHNHTIDDVNGLKEKITALETKINNNVEFGAVGWSGGALFYKAVYGRISSFSSAEGWYWTAVSPTLQNGATFIVNNQPAGDGATKAHQGSFTLGYLPDEWGNGGASGTIVAGQQLPAGTYKVTGMRLSPTIYDVIRIS